MSKPKIKTDNSGGFLAQTFAELLGEMEAQDSGTLTCTRDDGQALALLTTDPRVIKIVETVIADCSQMLSEEAAHD